MKKTILFVIDSLNSGGAEKSLISLLSIFDYEKYNVDLLMFSVEGLYLPLIPEKVNIIGVPDFIVKKNCDIYTLLRKKSFRELAIRLRTTLALRDPIKKKKMHSAQIIWECTSKEISNIKKHYDFAIAYSQGLPTYFVAEKVNAYKKLCWINTDYKKAPYNKKFDRAYYQQYDKVVAVSDYNKEVFIKEMPSVEQKTTVIYDIISPKLIELMASQEGGFYDNFNGIKILTIGRLVDVKGYDLAIKAAYKLKKEGILFKWYSIGEGIQRTKYEKMVQEYGLQDYFFFLGTHKNPYTYLKQCDIYVQPSRFEGYGLALAEARLLEKPIVATNFTVVHNQIKNRENGIIVNTDADEIYKGIKEIIEDNTLKESLCKNLRNEQVGTEEEIDKVYSILQTM
jgi:glycosyltransferase involved in cell wall biosynthesis